MISLKKGFLLSCLIYIMGSIHPIQLRPFIPSSKLFPPITNLGLGNTSFSFPFLQSSTSPILASQDSVLANELPLPNSSTALPEKVIPQKNPYDAYRLRYFPGQDALRDKINEHKTFMTENPLTSTAGGIAGSLFGYGYAQAYIAGAQKGNTFLERRPQWKETLPKRLISMVKQSANPHNPANRLNMIWSIGHYCVVGLAASQSIQQKWNKFTCLLNK
jgi:hypothetical protein